MKTYYKIPGKEAGCDEAGRGCLAGPVVAAAVIWPEDFVHPLIKDSKKLSASNRTKAAEIVRKHAIAYAIGIIDNREIDKINILNASFKAMHLAVRSLKIAPDLLIIDGNRFNPYPDTEHFCIVKGDAKYYAVAAASILAKTERDKLMQSYHQEFPEYLWQQNKGYPSKAHRQAISEIGPSPLHRRSFRLYPDGIQLKMFK